MLSSKISKDATKEILQMSVIFLGLYFFLLPLDFFDIGNETSLMKFLSLLPVCAVFFNFKHIKVDILGSFLLLLYIFMNVISYFYSVDADATIQRAKSVILNYVLIIFCSTILVNSREKTFLTRTVIASGFIAIILVLFFNDFHEGRIIMKIGESKQDPNYYCGYVMFATLCVLSAVLTQTRKVLSSMLFIALYLVVFLTGSRGGLIAIGIACLVLFYFESKNQSLFFKIIVVIALVLILYVILMNVVPPEVRMRFDPTYTKKDGGAGRFDIWKDLWKDFDSFTIMQKMFGTGAATVTEYGLHGAVAHNLWLETLIELGWVGLFVQIATYAYFLIKAFKLKNKVYFANMIGFMVMTLSMSLYTYKPIYALFIMINIVSHDETEKTPQYTPQIV